MGMTFEDFMHQDEELFRCYQIAYIKKLSYMGWMNGLYALNANSVSLSNAFNKDSKATYIEKPIDYTGIEEKPKNKIKADIRNTPLEQDLAYRQYMLEYCY